MKERILQAYQKWLTERADGVAQTVSAKDKEAAALAARHSEAELRHALAMRGAYERAEWQKAKAVQA